MTAYVVPLLLCALGMGGVYLGIGFLNGILWPQIFGALYAVTESPVLRIIAAFPIFFGPSNYLVGKAYEVGGATMGGVGTLVFTVLWMTVMAVIVDQAKVNMWVVGGFTFCLVGCFMLIYGIKGI